MDPLDVGFSGLGRPPIPSAGLREVLSQWIGRGDLFEGLAFFDEEALSSWSAADIEARAHRILLERLKPLVALLPTRADKWADLLPAVRLHEAAMSVAPTSGTSWPETRIRFGWPPTEFVGRQAARHADTLLATALRWTFERLAEVRASATAVYPEADAAIRQQIDAACRAASRQPLASVPAIRPGRHDLMAIRRAGTPWGIVSEIVNELALLDAPPYVLATTLLAPDDGIRWRLFHLGVLGEVLQSARQLGYQVRSCGPVRPGGRRPSFALSDADGGTVDLWFEASGIWQAMGLRSPYAEAASGIALRERMLGADLLLRRPDGAFLIVECKYSSNPDFVARNGYYQAVTYAAELASRTYERVTAIAVGPEGVVGRAGFTDLKVGRIGICPPSAIHEVMRVFLA